MIPIARRDGYTKFNERKSKRRHGLPINQKKKRRKRLKQREEELRLERLYDPTGAKRRARERKEQRIAEAEETRKDRRDRGYQAPGRRKNVASKVPGGGRRSWQR